MAVVWLVDRHYIDNTPSHHQPGAPNGHVLSFVSEEPARRRRRAVLGLAVRVVGVVCALTRLRKLLSGFSWIRSWNKVKHQQLNFCTNIFIYSQIAINSVSFSRSLSLTLVANRGVCAWFFVLPYLRRAIERSVWKRIPKGSVGGNYYGEYPWI